MHQEHNIPWRVFPSNFKWVIEDQRFTRPYTGLMSMQRPTQVNELNHFVRKMISTIQEFSKTERKKYPAPSDLKPPADGKLFSDQLRDKYPEFLNSNNQKFDYWNDYFFHYRINRSHADIIKILIHENQMETVLMLANHPRLPLYSLHEEHDCYYSYGFRAIIETALIPYIFWNLMAIFDNLTPGIYKVGEVYERVTRHIIRGRDFGPSRIPHWQFHGIKYVMDEIQDVDPARLREYLKHLFCLLYRYDMVIAECGEDPGWEGQIMSCLSLYFSVQKEFVRDADGHRKFQFSSAGLFGIRGF